ncbi:prophage tail fiber N-terminal domain-containing protein, partial [Serratia fonticola]|uniref:phage tail fiber protein n=1 Tax=Serratia fonticola TaxID=47917 RepID=UPI003AAC8EC4
RSQSVTDATGRYTLSVEPGQYDVMITAAGRQPERVGGIQVMVNSATGTLNDFLTIPGETDLNPAIVAAVDGMRAAAAASAAAAKTSETNAAAAMANALSKTVTTAQSVAGSVTFNKGLIGIGAVDAKAISSTSNPVIRLMTDTGVEKVAIIAEQDPVGIQIRWSGKAQSALFYNDGTVRFPGVVQSGTTALMKTGDYGLGSLIPVVITDMNVAGENQFVRCSNNTPGAPTTGPWAGLQGGHNESSRYQLVWRADSNVVDLRARCSSWSSGFGSWASMWHTANTTVDANGFIKKASPIVKLFADGSSELNGESQGVTTERVSEGVYRVSGTLGFNSDAEWGGVDGGIEIPTDRNKLPLVWVDYEVDETGDLLIKTFHRVNSTAPKFAQNVKVGYKEGQPIDIPAGRWIDLRVEMPGGDEPEYELVPEDEVPEVTPEVTEPEVGEEPAPGEVSAPIEETKE